MNFLKGSGDEMGLGQRLHNSINEWAVEWRDTILDWLGDVFTASTEKVADFFEPDIRTELAPLLQRVLDIPDLPPDIKNIFEKAKTEPQAIQLAFLLPMAIGLLLGAGMGMAQPLMKLGSYQLDKFVHSARLDPMIATRALFRKLITPEYFTKTAEELGWSTDDIKTIIDVSKYYPSPLELVNWQAKEVFEPLTVAEFGLEAELDELDREAFYKAGMTDEQIRNFWVAHWQHPAFREVTEMLHRGLLTPEFMQKWYKVVEIPPIYRENLTKISWDLPNRIELRMMARFGLVDKPFLLEQLKQVGLTEEFRDVAADMMLTMGIRTDLSTRYSKGWINAGEVRQELEVSGLSVEVADRLFQWIVKNTQTERVAKERNLTLAKITKGVRKDVITRGQAQDLIQDMGYDTTEAKLILDIDAPAEATVKEVKQRQLSKADIMKAYKLEEFDRSETLSRLIELRFSPDDAETLARLVDITKGEIPDERQRELTKIDIIQGVKAGVITPEEGYIMLQDIGYSAKDAQFILDVKVEAEAGSPDTLGEFKDIVEVYRASIGLPGKPVPLELIIAERAVKAGEVALADGRSRKVKPKRLLELEQTSEEAKIKHHQLLTEFNK